MNPAAPASPLDHCLATYCAAWNEPDPAQRTRMLEGVWRPDGLYTDPTVHVVGIPDLVAHIARAQAQFPRSHVVATSLFDTHHIVARFTWQRILADGTARPEGIDFAEVAPDGKLARIVGFFGPVPRP